MRGKLSDSPAAPMIESRFNEARALCAGNSVSLSVKLTT